jgi:DNA uptake protein ComE-like DNA-binding protein
MPFQLSTPFNLAILSLTLLACAACSPNQTPDQLRQQTARETEALKRDTKAVAEGVRDGLSSKKVVDLNRASKDDLMSLPGITSSKADRIIAARPYASAHQLESRHVLSEDEYSQIQDRVTVTK